MPALTTVQLSAEESARFNVVKVYFGISGSDIPISAWAFARPPDDIIEMFDPVPRHVDAGQGQVALQLLLNHETVPVGVHQREELGRVGLQLRADLSRSGCPQGDLHT